MKKQKVLVLGNLHAEEMQKKIDPILEDGWYIVSVTSQHVATGSPSPVRGGYLIVFEKPVISK